jgi:hypothetical protein
VSELRVVSEAEKTLLQHVINALGLITAKQGRRQDRKTLLASQECREDPDFDEEEVATRVDETLTHIILDSLICFWASLD